MKVNSIQPMVSFKSEPSKKINKKSHNGYLVAPIAGYSALGLGLASGVLAYKKKIAAHKITALAALGAVVVHVASIKIMSHRAKSKSV